ncbi:unnamed protein product [Caenorhabditis brenneri]
MFSKAISIFMALNLAVPAVGISCYGYNAYTNQPTTQHNKSFCTAFYEVANGQGTFSGADRDPLKTEKLKWDFNQGTDCQMQKQRMHEGEEWQVVYTCFCFTPMCNFPFSFKEFETRGFTLAPKPVKANSIW